MPPLRRAVELGDDEPGHADRGVRTLRLRERVLAGGAVEHQQHFVRRARSTAGDDAPDLLQLVHQLRLRVQPAGGVGDQHVDAARARGLSASKTTARGIGAPAGR